MTLESKEIFSKNLRHYMSINNLSRNDLCEKLDIKYMTLSDWINGNTYPRIDKIEMLADFFGINKSDLIEDKVEVTSTDPKEVIKSLLQNDVIAANTGININDYTDEELEQITNRLLDYARFLDNDKKLDK